MEDRPYCAAGALSLPVVGTSVLVEASPDDADGDDEETGAEEADK